MRKQLEMLAMALEIMSTGSSSVYGQAHYTDDEIILNEKRQSGNIKVRGIPHKAFQRAALKKRRQKAYKRMVKNSRRAR